MLGRSQIRTLSNPAFADVDRSVGRGLLTQSEVSRPNGKELPFFVRRAVLGNLDILSSLKTTLDPFPVLLEGRNRKDILYSHEISYEPTLRPVVNICWTAYLVQPALI
jgi:hypothetical protein